MGLQGYMWGRYMRKTMSKVRSKKLCVDMYLDLPKGAEWMIRGAYTPSFSIKQHPLEDAGM